jgi:hypothetical protein
MSSAWQSVGQGPTATAARNDAMGKLAIQIAARIKSVCRSVSQHVETNDGYTANESMRCETLSQSATSPTDPKARWSEFLIHNQLATPSGETTYYWQVTLDRERMARVFSAEVSELADSFVRKAEVTLDDVQDRRGFVAGWSVLNAEMKPQLARRLAALLMLDRPKTKLRLRIQRSDTALNQAAKRLRNMHPVTLVWAKQPPGDLARRFGQAGLALGVKLKKAGALCIRLNTTPVCKENAFAMPTCNLVFKGRLKPCGTGKATPFTWHPPIELAGVDRQNRDKAAYRAAEQLTPVVLQGFWRYLLGSELPL